MRDIQTWLREIRLHQEDSEWLNAHADEMYRFIKQHTRHHTVQDIFKMLVLVAPHFMWQSDRRQWHELFYTSLTPLMNLKDKDKEQQAWQHLGNFSLMSGDYKTADVAFAKSFERTEDETLGIDAVVGWLHAHTMKLAADETPDYYDLLFAYARTHDNPHTTGLIYKIAAHYHLSHLDVAQAMGFAQMAIGVWWQTDQTRPNIVRESHMGQAFLILGVASRLLGKLDLAANYIQRAVSHLERLPHAHNLYVVYYEQAIHLIEIAQFAAAEARLREVVDYAEGQDLTLFAAYAHYSLGCALMEQGQFGEAHTRLLRALATWKRLENWVEIVRTEHAIGCLYLFEGVFPNAAQWLQHALTNSDNISSKQHQMFLRKAIYSDIDDLNAKFAEG